MNNIAVIGSSGAIGQALTLALARHYPHATVYAFSRLTNPVFTEPNITSILIDYSSEDEIAIAAKKTLSSGALDLVIIATGILHDTNSFPEKSVNELNINSISHVFSINTFLPALVAKHFIPLLNTNTKSIMIALSARVGSISDNKLGGWYSYRASKAALNMIFKTLAIEYKRRNDQGIIISLHPGTVDSKLSLPFQKRIPKQQLQSPAEAASHIVQVIENLTPNDTGKFFSWDGTELLP